MQFSSTYWFTFSQQELLHQSLVQFIHNVSRNGEEVSKKAAKKAQKAAEKAAKKAQYKAASAGGDANANSLVSIVD